MTEARDLLGKLLGYIEEQAKEVDPRSYRLSAAKGFMKSRKDLRGLPGVEFDVKVEGDHIWLRVERLAADRPPRLPDERVRNLGLIRISGDPDGRPPSIDESALNASLEG